MTRSGSKPMGISKNIPHSRRIAIIRHLIFDLGLSPDQAKGMNATDKEIDEMLEREWLKELERMNQEGESK